MQHDRQQPQTNPPRAYQPYPKDPPVGQVPPVTPPPSARPAMAYHSPTRGAARRKQDSPRRRFLFAICLALLCLLAGGGAAFFVFQYMVQDFQTQLETQRYELEQSLLGSVTAALPDLLPDVPVSVAPAPGGGMTAEAVYLLGRQQVVGITTEITTTNVFGQSTTQTVTGSGFILTEDGYILTNYHVIENADRIWVMLGDYSLHPAELIGGEGVTSDVAVLKIDGTDLYLSPVAIGSSAGMPVGSTIFAIGNPLGELTYTITAGIVSALNREIAIEPGQRISMFQIDAAVNSGNSGGPVYNDAGEVVGVVTAKALLSGVEGIGFAIPIDDAMRYARQLMEHGRILRPHLGIVPATLTDAQAEEAGISPGVFVHEVQYDTAAYHAGILEGDIIVAFGDAPTRTAEDLWDALQARAPGDLVVLRVFRDGEYHDVSVTLGSQ